MKWHPPLVYHHHQPSVRCPYCYQNVPLHKESGLPQEKYRTSNYNEFACPDCFRNTRKCSVWNCRARDFNGPFADGFHCGDCYWETYACSCYHCMGYNEDGTRNLRVKSSWIEVCERNGCTRPRLEGQKTCSKHADS